MSHIQKGFGVVKFLTACSCHTVCHRQITRCSQVDHLGRRLGGLHLRILRLRLCTAAKEENTHNDDHQNHRSNGYTQPHSASGSLAFSDTLLPASFQFFRIQSQDISLLSNFYTLYTEITQCTTESLFHTQFPKGHCAGSCHIQRIHPMIHGDLHGIIAANDGRLCQSISLRS